MLSPDDLREMSMIHNSLPSLQDRVDSLIRDGDLETPLVMIQAFVERIVSDPQAIGRVFSAPVLDEICLRLGAQVLSQTNVATPAPSEARIVYVATEFYRHGGHTLVAADFVRYQPDREHVFLMTDVLSNPHRDAPDLRLVPLGAKVQIAPTGPKLEKLRWLLTRLFELAPEKIYWFNHHHDAVAIAAAQPAIPGDRYFIHHADHQLCLGVHTPHLHHVDLANLGFFNCRDVLRIANHYWPLVCDDLGPRDQGRRFIEAGRLRTCSSGSGNKFEISYLYDYAGVLARVLRATGGDHVHVGPLSEGYLERIRQRLADEAIPQERFIYVPWVPSLWRALIERDVDVYLASWPIGGGKALIEAMGAGIPSIVHVNYISRFHSGFDLNHPAAPTWRTPAELVDRLAAFNPDTLASQSRAARVHYEMHHAPKVLASLLSSDVQNALKPIPLRDYRPDTLQAFLDERAQTHEALASEQRLGEALALANGQVGRLTQDVRAYQQQAEEFDRQLREAHSQIGTAEEDQQRLGEALTLANGQVGKLGEALASANGQVGKLTEDVRVYQQQAEEFEGQLGKLAEQRTYELGSCRFLARQLVLALRTRISNSMRTAYPLRTTRRLISKVYSAGQHTVSLWKDEKVPFDADFYLDLYPDVANAGIDPYRHFVNYGRNEGRIGTPQRLEYTVSPQEDVPSEKVPFDSDFYLKLYPDIANAGIDPYWHFVNYGRKEGRIGTGPKLEYSGRMDDLSPNRKTILVVSHEGSRTGAPILSLNIVRELKKKYNVITLLLGGGAIVDDFRISSDVVIGPLADRRDGSLVIDQLLSLSHFSFAIVCSIESRAVLPELARRFVPAVTLIHEFAAYTRPKGALREAVFASAETVFSTPLTLENAISEYSDLGNCQFHIIPQGRCALPAVKSDTASRITEDAKVLSVLRPEGLPKDTVVVLGAGTVHMRKGVDLFIECAARVVHGGHGENCRFVWIGGGYDPEHDLSFSVYLADQIRRSGLQEHVVFMEETSSIEAAYRAADLLLISSRLDPLPNVAIDAMAHGLPVVCFEKATGIADILSANDMGEVCVASYLDTAEMASKVLALARSKALRQKVGEQLRQLALNQFDMERYVKQLEELALSAGDRIAQERTNVEEITKSGLYRLDFFLPPHLKGELSDDAIWRYVRSWASGMERRKLFPGFHPGIFLEQHGVRESGGDPLVNYLRAGQPDGPWRYGVITSEEIAQPLAPETRIALHLHVYYPDLLAEMLTRLNRNRIRPDLFISVPTEAVRDEVRRELRDYSGKVIEIQVVPNRGRDIGPFLTAFGAAFVDGYDLVGHLHTKKTADVQDDMLGKNWHLFLLENLLGGKGNMADIILGRMAVDPSIGMVFPDDPYVVGWDSNRSYAEALGQQLGLSTLPEYFLFPVGMMFWARVQFLRPIFNLGLVWQDYPPEPLPYDGSVLHALERLLPFVVSNQGAHSVLTNVVGITR